MADFNCWRPTFIQAIPANRSVRVDVWVVDFRGEVDLRWLVRVFSWELNVQIESTSSVWGVIRSNYEALPVVLSLVDWSGTEVGLWVLAEVGELFLNSMS